MAEGEAVFEESVRFGKVQSSRVQSSRQLEVFINRKSSFISRILFRRVIAQANVASVRMMRQKRSRLT